MKRLLNALCLLVCSSVACADGDPLSELKRGQPKDVVAMVDRIAMCNHFSGEEPYDAARSKEIAAAMKRYGCDRLDKDEAMLRERYRQSEGVQTVLRNAHEW